MLNLTPSLNANSCEFCKWGYPYSSVPSGYSAVNIAKPFSGIVYRHFRLPTAAN